MALGLGFQAEHSLAAGLAKTFVTLEHPMTTANIALQIFTDMEAVEAQWRTLEQHADCTVFQLFDWQMEWYRHIGSKEKLIPVIVLGLDDTGVAVFILPLAIERHGLIRRLVWLGSELCDYNSPILAINFSDHVKPGQFGRLWKDIIRTIQDYPQLRFDAVEFYNMPRVVGSQPNPFLDLPVLLANCGGHVATLPEANWDRFYASKFSNSTLHTHRRKAKNLAKQGGGAIRFVDVQEQAEIECTITKLIEQKRSSYARMGVHDVFARPGFREFYLAIVANPRLCEVIHVTRLDVAGIPVATGLGLRFNSSYSLVMSSYEDEFAKYSPGRQHIQEMMQYAIGQKMQKFDFTIGDEPYKLAWSDINLPLFFHFDSRTLRGRIVTAARMAIHYVDTWYNQTTLLKPPLRQVLRKTRRSLRRMFI